LLCKRRAAAAVQWSSDDDEVGVAARLHAERPAADEVGGGPWSAGLTPVDAGVQLLDAEAAAVAALSVGGDETRVTPAVGVVGEPDNRILGQSAGEYVNEARSIDVGAEHWLSFQVGFSSTKSITLKVRQFWTRGWESNPLYTIRVQLSKSTAGLKVIDPA